MKDPKVIERLRELESAGNLTPDRVIEDARNPKSPLHEYFEWDKDSAHAKYLVIQARELIRSVRVVIERNEHKISVIGYVRDPDAKNGEQGYSSVASIKTDKERAREVLTQELRRAESALQRAYDVADALGLSSEVGAILARLQNTMAAA